MDDIISLQELFYSIVMVFLFKSSICYLFKMVIIN